MMLGFGMGWLWLVVLGLAVWFAIDRAGTSTRPLGPRQELEERYARGEIDTEEFTARLDHLRSTR